MDRQFIWSGPDGSRREGTLAKLMAAAGNQLHAGAGRFQLEQDGDAVGSPLTRLDALRKLRRRVTAGDVGPVYRELDKGGDRLFWCREVKDAVKVIDTSGNQHADLFWSWVVATFPQFHPRFAGAYVCKTIAGSSTMSQHSYGNAVDIFFDSMAHQVEVFKACERGEAPVKIAHAISGDRVWTPDGGEDHYSGEFHSHLHTDYLPQFSGPCGVREP